MTKTTITTLVQDMCYSKANAAQLSTYFDDVMEQICKMPNCPFVDTYTDASVAAQADYDFPANAVRIIAIFYNEIPLSYATVAQLEAYDDDWRNLGADPRFYTFEDATARTFTLAPTPDTSSDDIVIVYTDNRSTDIEDWIAFSIALSMLSKEFARPSDHQDIKFSEACKVGAQILQQAAGI